MTGTKLIRQILKRDGGRCVIAGPHCVGDATAADHRANRGMGGGASLDDPRNLIAACVLCNGWKEDTTDAARERLIRRGIRVRKQATNARTLDLCEDIPVEYPDGSWWVLHPDLSRTQILSGIALERIALFVEPVRREVS